MEFDSGCSQVKQSCKEYVLPSRRFTTEVLLKAKAGTELVAGTASVEELVEHADGFAEVFPEHKVRWLLIVVLGYCREVTA